MVISEWGWRALIEGRTLRHYFANLSFEIVRLILTSKNISNDDSQISVEQKIDIESFFL